MMRINDQINASSPTTGNIQINQRRFVLLLIGLPVRGQIDLP
jgi:hypothetical protein